MMPHMQTSALAAIFGDSASEPYLKYDAFDAKIVAADLEHKGFSIVRGLIPERLVRPIRDFWLMTFEKPVTQRVTWAPYLGQPNTIGFSTDAFQYLYRACDFYWNEPMHKESREVGIRLNALRNLLLAKDPFYGLRFTDGRYGIFMTASYYPAIQGFMDEHRDGVKKQQTLIHCLAPFTLRGPDYQSGGMTITGRDGVRVDVEGTLKLGDAVFYDGFLEHGVEPIVPLPGKNIGRLQLSPLPTFFSDLASNPRALNTIPLSAVVGARLASLKNTVRIALGMKPGLR